jgi:hypothetical protein
VSLLHALLVPADFVMGRQMLRGVRRRAESLTPSAPIGGAISDKVLA